MIPESVSASASATLSPAAAFESLPGPLQHVMRKGGLTQELTEAGGISVTHLKAASQKMDVSIGYSLSTI